MNAAPHHGLSDPTLAEIARVLGTFPEVERAVLFGSRAKGTHRLGSDIDLALFGQALDWRLLGRIEAAIEDSTLPYRFSLVHRNAEIDADLAAHIARSGQEIYAAADAHDRSESRLQKLWKQGAEAWAGVPSASAWVEEQRGNPPER